MCLATNLFFNTASAMEEELSLASPLSGDILQIIFKDCPYQDWSSFSVVSKWWKENLEKMLMPFFVKEAEDIAAGEDSRKLLISSLVVKYIFSMESWNNERMEKAIKDINFSSLQKLLLKNLEYSLVFDKTEPGLKANMDSALFRLVKHFANLGVYPLNTTEAITFDVAWITAWDDARKAADEEVYGTSREVFENVDWHALKKSARIIFDKALEEYKSKPHDEMRREAWEISSLFIMAHIAQDKDRENKNIKGYKEANKILLKVTNYQEPKNKKHKFHLPSLKCLSAKLAKR